MDRHNVGRHGAAVRRFAGMLVAVLMFALFAGTGGLASAAGPGPVFSNIKASSSEVMAGDTVFLTTRLTSSADILGNPTVSYLFPDGTPGPAVAFSRVGGSLRDGEWQATLPLSQYLPSGSYVVGELRAMDMAGNGTVAAPDESLMNAANLTVTNVAQQPGIITVSGDEISAPEKSTAPSRPSECNSPHPRGPFFTGLSFSKTSGLAPGDSITVFAKIIDCDTTNYDFAGASIRLQYQGSGGPKDGPFTTFVRHRDGGDYWYKSTLTLFNPSPCTCKTLSIKQLRAWDGQGNDNYYEFNKPYWPSFGNPMFR